jgi:CheY-like chemotaxis protein
MVADDSKVVRIKTGRLLAQHQYQVSYANDGLDAVQQMQAAMPDVLITDVEMPGMDGFELTRHIRGNPQTAQLPVIMITAADDRHREHAEQVGVSVLLGKPYPEDALIAHIRQAMGQDAAPPQAAGSSRHGALDALA